MPDFMITFFAAYAMFFALLMAIPVGMYVLQSIGLHSMSKKAGLENPWLAWLPIGNLYLMGALAEKSNLYYGKKKGAYRVWLPLLCGLFILFLPIFFILLALVITFLEGTGEEEIGILFFLFFYLFVTAFSLAFSVLNYVVLYKIYKLYAPDEAVVYLILSIFVSVSSSIIFFLLRNRDFPMPPMGGAYPPPYGQPPYGQPPYGQPPYGQPPKVGNCPPPPSGEDPSPF